MRQRGPNAGSDSPPPAKKRDKPRMERIKRIEFVQFVPFVAYSSFHNFSCLIAGRRTDVCQAENGTEPSVDGAGTTTDANAEGLRAGPQRWKLYRQCDVDQHQVGGEPAPRTSRPQDC